MNEYKSTFSDWITENGIAIFLLISSILFFVLLNLLSIDFPVELSFESFIVGSFIIVILYLPISFVTAIIFSALLVISIYVDLIFNYLKTHKENK